MTKTVQPGTTTFALSAKNVEGVHLRAGAYHGWFDVPIVGAGVWATLGGYEE